MLNRQPTHHWHVQVRFILLLDPQLAALPPAAFVSKLPPRAVSGRSILVSAQAAQKKSIGQTAASGAGIGGMSFSRKSLKTVISEPIQVARLPIEYCCRRWSLEGQKR